MMESAIRAARIPSNVTRVMRRDEAMEESHSLFFLDRTPSEDTFVAACDTCRKLSLSLRSARMKCTRLQLTAHQLPHAYNTTRSQCIALVMQCCDDPHRRETAAGNAVSLGNTNAQQCATYATQ
ncbi:hypothetical protein Tcan_06971 [Toxocara canis]|uniref:Uncharacterized protein n=1 Tax=Toxocara canis TaxID=6265 RepID=A0A0B2VZ63_TOXCA|nr:hypothetical protein Tcan_06971 [Toxocara canis]